MIPAPFLLYLGAATDPIAIKTSRGLAVFRPEDCLGQWREVGSALTLDLADLTPREAAARGAETLVLGVANAGGVVSAQMVADALEAIQAGLHVASGLHQRLREIPQLVEAAAAKGVQLFDVRDPPEVLAVGTGAKRAGNRCLTVGTDCSTGKMYASLSLWRRMKARGIKADFRATGQTGILVAGAGIPLDAVVADFISGAIEALSPARDDGGWDLIEGQGSLFHPSFAGVSLGLLHGSQPDVLVMCHDPERTTMRGLKNWPPPGLADCIAANLQAARLTNPAVRIAGIAINGSRLEASARDRLCAALSEEHGLPCLDPFATSPDAIIDRMLG